MVKPDVLVAILLVSVGLALVLGSGWPLIGGGVLLFFVAVAV